MSEFSILGVFLLSLTDISLGDRVSAASLGQFASPSEMVNRFPYIPVRLGTERSNKRNGVIYKRVWLEGIATILEDTTKLHRIVVAEGNVINIS